MKRWVVACRCALKLLWTFRCSAGSAFAKMIPSLLWAWSSVSQRARPPCRYTRVFTQSLDTGRAKGHWLRNMPLFLAVGWAMKEPGGLGADLESSNRYIRLSRHAAFFIAWRESGGMSCSSVFNYLVLHTDVDCRCDDDICWYVHEQIRPCLVANTLHSFSIGPVSRKQLSMSTSQSAWS